jgi:hypothetical protein
MQWWSETPFRSRFKPALAKELVVRWLALICLALVGLAFGFGEIPSSRTREAAVGWSGKLDGSWHWTLPNTPNGLHPTQSWHATGSSPDGDIYVGGMDHVTNSAASGSTPPHHRVLGTQPRRKLPPITLQSLTLEGPAITLVLDGGHLQR